MKKLIIVRHAKSSWGYNVIDHERPLNERGFSDAERISKYLKSENLSIDLVISSDALRAKSTAEIFVRNLNINPDMFNLNHDLYDFSGEQLIKTITSVNDDVNCLMLFGHNHAVTDFVNTFGNVFIDNVSTSGVVILEFDISTWKNLSKGITQKTLFPRDFNE